jgi:hypothetical protein
MITNQLLHICTTWSDWGLDQRLEISSCLGEVFERMLKDLLAKQRDSMKSVSDRPWVLSLSRLTSIDRAAIKQQCSFFIYEFSVIFELSPLDRIEWEKEHSVGKRSRSSHHSLHPAHEKV